MREDTTVHSGPTVEYDQQQNLYRSRHDFTGEDGLTGTLTVALEAAASREGVELTTSLFEVVGPDGLCLPFHPREVSTKRGRSQISDSGVRRPGQCKGTGHYRTAVTTAPTVAR